MNCIIVDDKISCKQLEKYAVENASINLVGTFPERESAKKVLSENKHIDLVFIDINLVGLEFFDFINKLGNPPNIIIVTSIDEYAYEAFEYNVVDYLIKPVSYSRFCRAVDRTSRYFSRNNQSNQNKEDVYIRRGRELIKLKVSEIVLIGALENYITIYIGKEKYSIHFTMKGIEMQLPSDIFIRVHKSYIVNRTRIKSIKEDSIDLVFGNNIRNIPIGKTFRDSLLKSLNLYTMNK